MAKHRKTSNGIKPIGASANRKDLQSMEERRKKFKLGKENEKRKKTEILWRWIMSQTQRARELLAQHPPTPEARYHVASLLIEEYGITRNQARVTVNRALSQPKPRGGARPGGGRKKQKGDNQ